MEEETSKVYYHYGFYGAIHTEYEPKNIDMDYLQEYELGDAPVRVDMLIIKKGHENLTDKIGQFFKKYNVLEYKSPDDGLTIDDFYKIQGYALLYKGLSKTVNEIALNEITISLFSHSYPREMIAILQKEGYNIDKNFSGVYYVTGKISVPVQIVVLSRLEQKEYSSLKILSKNAKREDVLNFLEQVTNLDSQSPSYNDYIRSVLKVSMAVNMELYNKLKEESVMEDAFKIIFEKELSDARLDGWNKGQIDGWNKGQIDGWNKGQIEGKNEGRILEYIDLKQEDGCSEDEILKGLVKRFNLSNEKAMEYMTCKV